MAEVEAWAAELAEVHARIAPRFARAEPRERVLAYVRGLLAPLEKKNSWTLAERAGEAIPDGMQRLLVTRTGMPTRSVTMCGLRGRAPRRRAGVLVVDETGFLKKGTKSAGVPASTPVRRADRELPDRCLPGLCERPGRTFLDRELYLPREWAEDPSVGRGRASRRTWSSRPSLTGDADAWSGRSTRAYRPAGSPAMRSTASRPACG